MARLTQDDKDKILADYHIGKSQNQLAKDYSCSPATINKICKGITPKYKDKVNTVVSIKSELAEESEYQSECFDKEVNDKLRRKNLVFNATEKIVQRATQMINDNKVVEKINVGDGVQNFEPRELNTSDLKNLADAVDKASVTLGVNQRHSNQSINVNTQTNVQNNSIELTEEEAMKEAERLGVPLSALM